MGKKLVRQKKLTKSIVDAAEPRIERYIIWDGALPGFGLRVTPNNAKSFVLRYRPRRGGRSALKRFITIGHFGILTAEQARHRAVELLGEVAKGNDPAASAQKESQSITVAAAARATGRPSASGAAIRSTGGKTLTAGPTHGSARRAVRPPRRRFVMPDVSTSELVKPEANDESQIPLPSSDQIKTEPTVTAELDKRLAEIARDLRAANMSCLQRAALLREFADKLALKDFRHDVEKRRGRPPGLTKLMADRLKDVAPGKSPEAKQKWIERALKVAGLPEKVVEAAKQAGLAESQNHLLAIAEAFRSADADYLSSPFAPTRDQPTS